jgi:hypothetical protein
MSPKLAKHDDKYLQLCLQVKLGVLPRATVPPTCCERRISQRIIQYLTRSPALPRCLARSLTPLDTRRRLTPYLSQAKTCARSDFRRI